MMALEPAKDMGDYVKAVEQVRDQVAALHAQVPPDRIPMWVVLGPGASDHRGCTSPGSGSACRTMNRPMRWCALARWRSCGICCRPD